MKQVYGEAFVSPKVRLQYVNVAKPDEGHKFSRGNYNVTALLPKKDKKGLQLLYDAIADVAGIDVNDIDDLEKHPLLDGKGRLRDGDAKQNAKKEGHPGNYIFIVSSSNPIDCYVENDDGEVVDCDAKEIYSGCWAKLALQPAMYEEGEVTFYLQGIVKVDDDSRFSSGRTDTKQLFANWGGKSAAEANGHDVDEDEEEDEKPLKKKKVRAAEADDDEDEDEAPKKRGRPRKVEAEDDDEEEEDEKPKKRAAKSAKDDEDEDSEEDEPEESEEEDEEDEPPVKKRARKAGSSIQELLDE